MVARYGIYGDVEEMRRLTKDIAGADKAMKKATVSAVNKTAVSSRNWLVKKVNQEYKIKQKDVREALGISKANYSRIEARIHGKGKPGIPLYKFSPTPNRIPSTIHRTGTKKAVMGKRGRPLKRLRTVPGSDRYLPAVGVKVMVRRGSRKVVQGAFIARMSSGHVGIFRRINRASKRNKYSDELRATALTMTRIIGKTRTARDLGISRGALSKWVLAGTAEGSRAKVEELYGPSPLRILDSDHYHIPFDEFVSDTLDKNMAHEAEHYLRKLGAFRNV